MVSFRLSHAKRESEVIGTGLSVWARPDREISKMVLPDNVRSPNTGAAAGTWLASCNGAPWTPFCRWLTELLEKAAISADQLYTDRPWAE